MKRSKRCFLCWSDKLKLKKICITGPLFHKYFNIWNLDQNNEKILPFFSIKSTKTILTCYRCKITLSKIGSLPSSSSVENSDLKLQFLCAINEYKTDGDKYIKFVADGSDLEIKIKKEKEDEVDENIVDIVENKKGSKRKRCNFICQKCPLVCSSDVVLERHLKDHKKYEEEKEPKEPALKCPLCLGYIFTRGKLKYHLKIYHSEKLHKCNICEDTAMSKSAVKQHKFVMHKDADDNKWFKCEEEECKKSFFGIKKFTQHIKIHDTFVCKFCNLTIKSRGFKKHLKIHLGKNKCVICDLADFSNMEEVEEHQEKFHFLSDHKCLKCKVCPGETFQFKTKLGFQQHLNEAHGTEKCPFCPKLFVSVKKVKRHVLKQHKKDEYECKICKKVVLNREQLWNHMANSHGEREECKICNKKINKHYMKSHIERTHGEKAKCKFCGEFFPERHLDYHIAALHSKQENCLICGKIFNIFKLKKHMRRVHSSVSNDMPGLIKKEKDSTEFIKIEKEIEKEASSTSGLINEKEEIKSENEKENLDSASESDSEYSIPTPTEKKKYKKFHCKKCPLVLHQKRKLEEHLVKHRKYEIEIAKIVKSSKLKKAEVEFKNSAKAVKCAVCGGFLFDKRLLPGHLKLVHNAGAFNCPFCHEKCITNYGLNYHIRLMHEVERPTTYKCTKCPKKFKNAVLLRSHSRIHRPKVKIECKICGKFLDPSSMDYHKSFVHKNKKR